MEDVSYVCDLQLRDRRIFIHFLEGGASYAPLWITDESAHKE